MLPLAVLACAMPGSAIGAAGSGGLIVFVSTRDGPAALYAVRPDGTHLIRLRTAATGAQSPRVSPDGRRVVFEDRNFGLRVLDLATGKGRPVAPGGGTIGFGWGSTRWPWSPDGSRFAVGADDGLVVFGSDGAERRRITHGVDGEPAWSLDGGLIAFTRSIGAPPSARDAIDVIRPDGTGLMQVVRDGDDPVWSPDGQEIAFWADPGLTGKIAIFVVPVNGGAARKIAPGTGYSWSPDSRTLAIEGDSGLALYGRDGALQRVLVKGTPAEDATWSPDGRSVLAVVDGDLQLFARDGSIVRRLTEGERDGYTNSDPTWSRSLPSAVSGTSAPAAVSIGGALVALSRATGLPVARFPRVSGVATDGADASIESVVDDGRGGWYIGGDFVSVGGVACQNLVHITRERTVDRGWCPRPNGSIRTLVRIGTTLFVAGENLTRIDEARRSGLAAFDTRQGRLTDWNPNVHGAVYEMAAGPSGKTIYFAGLFDRVRGVARSNLAAVDAQTGMPTAFAPNPDATIHGDSVSAFAVTATHVYAWGYYTRIGGRAVAGNTAQLDAHSGELLSWLPTVDGGPQSTAVVGARVFLGGVFSQLGGARRDDLASFTETTGTVDAWAPTTGPNQIVEQLALAGRVVFVALTRDHWSEGSRRLVAYDAASGKRSWQARATFAGVEAIAADESLVVVGGYLSHPSGG